MDEAIFQLKPYISKGYFKRGSRPRRKYLHNPRQKVLTFGALSEDEFVGMTAGFLNQQAFKKFVQKLYYKFRKIVLVIDNASWHHALSIREYVESRDIKLIFLPPYSPELNPIEQSWKKLKAILSTKEWASLQGLKNQILDCFRKQKLMVKLYDYLQV